MGDHSKAALPGLSRADESVLKPHRAMDHFCGLWADPSQQPDQVVQRDLRERLSRLRLARGAGRRSRHVPAPMVGTCRVRAHAAPTLFRSRGNGTVVVAAGAAYLSAVSADLDTAIAQDSSRERVSVVSAGARGNGARLPVTGLFREALGGTGLIPNAPARATGSGCGDSRLSSNRNGDVSGRHRPRSRSEPSTVFGRPATDIEVVLKETGERHPWHMDPSISRTEALRLLRRSGVACEQSRYARRFGLLQRSRHSLVQRPQCSNPSSTLSGEADSVSIIADWEPSGRAPIPLFCYASDGLLRRASMMLGPTLAARP